MGIAVGEFRGKIHLLKHVCDCFLPLLCLCLAIQPQRTGKNPPNFLARIERCIGVLKNELQSTPIVGPHLVRVSIDLAVERSEEHTSDLQSLMRTSSADFCLQ